MSDIWDRKRRYADLSKELDKLGAMPERTTREDLRKAASALLDASNDIDQLMNTQPKGCTCRRMEDDGRTWVSYDEQCQHHKWMLSEIKRIETAYKQHEAKLKDAVKMALLPAAIQGSLAIHPVGTAPGTIVERAMKVVDAAIDHLKGG